MKLLVAADRRDLGRDADRDRGEIVLAQLREQLHLAALGDGEQRRAAGADDLAGLDVALEHQPRGGGDDVEPRVARLQLAELRLATPHARARGIARRGQAVDVGLAR